MDFINYESDDDDDDDDGDSKLQKTLINSPKSMSETLDVKTNTSDPILIPCNNLTKHPLLSQLPTFVNNQSMNTETSRNIQDILDRESDFMQTLQSNRQFGNPYILTKIVSSLGIDEIGSNYPVALFDPHGYKLEDCEESITQRYTAPPAAALLISNPDSNSTEAFVRKKSRWDDR